jgi:type II secretory pathway component PulJ
LQTDPEGGFTLLELVVCVALLVASGAGALAVLPALARSAQAGIVRDAALEAARNVLERTRAAAAYYPAALVGDPAARATTTADHRWALGANATYASAARIVRPLCGIAAATADA